MDATTPLPQPDQLWYGTSGPRDAKIVLVGESWGYDEFLAKAPFVGVSGSELSRILVEAGIARSECLITNVCASRPPDNEFWRYFDGTTEVRGLYPNGHVMSELSRLHEQLAQHPRTLIIAIGNYSLWALSSLTGNAPVPGSAPQRPDKRPARQPTGIMSWRGSMVHTEEQVCGTTTPLLPIIHPAAILRQWDLRYITVHDLRARVPMALAGNWTNPSPPILLAPPTYAQCIARLDHWLRSCDTGPLRLAGDIETYRGIITCIGFAESPQFAMTIPFVRKVNTPTHLLESHWTVEQEAQITWRLQKLLTHPNLDLEGQNFLYDTQYIYDHWGVIPYANFDTMYAWHVCFPGTPKALDYLSSLFCCYHRYWKEDHKEWDLANGDVGTLLRYNAEDCVRTYECGTTIRQLVASFGLTEQWEWMKQKRDLALRMMLRGVKINTTLRDRLGYELMETHSELATGLRRVPRHKDSPPPQDEAGNPREGGPQ